MLFLSIFTAVLAAVTTLYSSLFYGLEPMPRLVEYIPDVNEDHLFNLDVDDDHVDDNHLLNLDADHDHLLNFDMNDVIPPDDHLMANWTDYRRENGGSFSDDHFGLALLDNDADDYWYPSAMFCTVLSGVLLLAVLFYRQWRSFSNTKEELQDLRKKIKDDEEIVTAAGEQIKHLRLKLQDEEKHHKTVEEKMNWKISVSSQENGDLKNAQNLLTKKLDDLQLQMDLHGKYASDLEAKLEERNNQITSLHSVLSEKKSELDKKDSTERLLQSDLKESENIIRQLKDKYTKLEMDKHDCLMELKEKTDTELRDLKNIIKDDELKATAAEEQIKHLTSKLQDQEAHHKTVERKMNEYNTTLAEQLICKSKEKESFKQKKEVCEQSLKQLERERLELLSKLKNEEKCHKQTEIIKNLKIALALKENWDLQNAQNLLTKKMDNLQFQMDSRGKYASDLEAKVELQNNQIKGLHSALSAKKVELDAKERNERRLQRDLNECENKIRQYDYENENLKRKLQQKDKVISERDAELNSSHAAEKKLLNNLQEMERQLRQLKDKNEKLEKDKNDLITELKDKETVEDKLRNDLKLREDEIRKRKEGSSKPNVVPRTPRETSLSAEQKQLQMTVEGKREMQRNNPANAITIFSAALNLGSFGSMTHDLFYHRALCHVQLQKYEKAAADCSSVLSQCPRHVRAYFLRAFCNVHTAKYEEAVADFKTLISLNHKDSERYIMRAEMIQKLASDVQDYQRNLEILKLGNNVTELDIKRAYRSLSLVHHPDKHVLAGETIRLQHQEEFKKLSAAYQTLLDAKERQKFETGLANLHKMRRNFLDLLTEKL